MATAFFINIYPIILNAYARNELKKYFGKMEIKNIIKRTNAGYKNMMKNHKNIKVDKNKYRNICVNTYCINIYMNIENKIPHDEYRKIQENIIKNCKILTARKK